MSDIDIEDDGISELIGAYVLDAVDDVERRRVERAMAADPRVADEVRGLRVVVETLDDDAERTPPPGLWASIRSATVDEPGAPAPAAVPRSRRLGGAGERPTRWLLAAAAVVAVFVIGGAIVVGLDRSNGTDDPVAQMTAMAEKLATTPGSRTAVLSDASSSMEVKVVVDAQGHGFVMSAPLPTLPSDETYQLWSATNGEMISVGLLGPDPTMSVVAIDASVTELALTREPLRGSVAPTSAPMMSGVLA